MRLVTDTLLKLSEEIKIMIDSNKTAVKLVLGVATSLALTRATGLALTGATELDKDSFICAACSLSESLSGCRVDESGNCVCPTDLGVQEVVYGPTMDIRAEMDALRS